MARTTGANVIGGLATGNASATRRTRRLAAAGSERAAAALRATGVGAGKS